MELTITQYSSLKVPPFISSCCKASSYVNRLIPIKPTTKLSTKSSNFPSKCATNKLNQPIGLYGENRFSKSLLFGQRNRNYSQACAQLESEGSDPVLDKDQTKSAGPNLVAKILRFGSVFYKFSRPYTMIQVSISSICMFARVMVENKHLFKWSLLLQALPGLIAIILANTYIAGINQIFDADIDRMNKPYLAIPTGDLSLKQAWLLTILSAIGGHLILWLMNANLITTCCFCFTLFMGTVYSAPPLRFKGSSIATVTLVSVTMSTLHHTGVLYASTTSLGLRFQWSPPNIFIITFVALFYSVACLTKDITDLEGDLRYNIRTFAAIIGPKYITILGSGILMLAYSGAIAVGIYMPQAFKRYLMLSAHPILAVWLLFQAKKLDKANYVKEASANFYQFLWNLINIEFLLFPFM
ncbi:homogentisate solanesyltransferase, chloroplastic-like [Morus notabilis]|uniref:homogentisate solanesyltransferase, chloroplastic-like n=1 Tax=Morus notabilis TaxID=981085 RepID=UPI000CED1917|nr:homogentisate solanesyltransferase, chloroplastic-like [Morus notabilis]